MNAMQPPQSIEEIKAGLETTEKGGVRQSIRNCLTVFQRDPLLSGAIAYNILTDRKAIFDVYCEGENGEKFIVEMQNAYQTYFKDRSLFYSTFPIREQAPKGKDWDFKLNHVYTVALLNFDMNEDAFEKEKIRHSVQLCDTATHKVFYEKLEFIYVEIAKFDKSLEELETLYDKWLYALKNLYKLTQRPKELCDKVFDRLFEEAEIAKFTPQEQREYEASKMASLVVFWA